MIADLRLQIEVDAFLSGWSKAFISKICILKSKITELHHSNRFPHEGKEHSSPSGGSPTSGPLGPDALPNITYQYFFKSLQGSSKTGMMSQIQVSLLKGTLV